MTWTDEEKSHNGEPKKSELLPTGERATEIVEVLVLPCVKPYDYDIEATHRFFGCLANVMYTYL